MTGDNRRGMQTGEGGRREREEEGRWRKKEDSGQEKGGCRLEKERKVNREKDREGRKETSKVGCRLEKEGEGRKRFQNDQHRYVAASL